MALVEKYLGVCTFGALALDLHTVCILQITILLALNNTGVSCIGHVILSGSLFFVLCSLCAGSSADMSTPISIVFNTL
jgi:hypothetical protein